MATGCSREFATSGPGPLGIDPAPCRQPGLFVIAAIEANRAGADEALLLNHHGYVTEGSADNLFIVKSDRLLTPPVIDGALDGELGIPAAERSLSPYDLHTADECFLTGTGAELIPVRDIDGRKLPTCPGPVFQKLAVAFREAVGAAS